MAGARSFCPTFTKAGFKKDPNTPDACAWTFEWKNPRPAIAIKDVTFVGAGTECTVIWLGLTAVK